MSVEEGFAEVYVVQWPLTPDAPAALAWVVMKRQGGALLALPTGFLSVADLEEQQDPSHPIGASVVLTVPAVQESEGGFMSMGFDMDVVVVDFQADVLEHITPLSRSNLPADAVQSFFVDVETLPDPYALVAKSKEWVVNLGGEMQGFYSAEEEVASPKPAVMKATPKKAGGEKAKRVSAPHHGRKYKVFGRVGPRLGSSADSYPGGADKDEARFRSSGCEVITEAESSPCFNGFADAGQSYGTSSQNKEHELDVASSKEDHFSPQDRHRRANSGADGGGRGGGSHGGESGRQCIGFGSPGAEPCPHHTRFSDAERRPLAGFSRKRFFNIFKGGPRQGEVASRVECEIRRIHAGYAAERSPSNEASQSFAGDSCPGCGERFFNGQLLGTLRRLRKLSRAGNHPVCPQLCDRCSSQRRPSGRSGTCSSSLRSPRTGLSGSRPLGSCIPSSVVGRPSITALDLQPQQLPGLHGQSEGIRPIMPTTLGDGIIGISERVGLHQQPTHRDHQEGPAKAGGVRGSSKEEEVSKRKGRRRPRRRCSQQLNCIEEDDQLFEGLRDDGHVAASSSGSALSNNGDNMPEFGFGGAPMPGGLPYEAQGARQPHGGFGIGGFGSQSDYSFVSHSLTRDGCVEWPKRSWCRQEEEVGAEAFVVLGDHCPELYPLP